MLAYSSKVTNFDFLTPRPLTKSGRPKGSSYARNYIYPEYHPLIDPEKFSYISKYTLPEKNIFEPSPYPFPEPDPYPNFRVSIPGQPPFYNTFVPALNTEGYDMVFFGGHFEESRLLKLLNKEHWLRRPMLFQVTKPFGPQKCSFFSWKSFTNPFYKLDLQQLLYAHPTQYLFPLINTSQFRDDFKFFKENSICFSYGRKHFTFNLSNFTQNSIFTHPSTSYILSTKVYKKLLDFGLDHRHDNFIYFTSITAATPRSLLRLSHDINMLTFLEFPPFDNLQGGGIYKLGSEIKLHFRDPRNTGILRAERTHYRAFYIGLQFMLFNGYAYDTYFPLYRDYFFIFNTAPYDRYNRTFFCCLRTTVSLNDIIRDGHINASGIRPHEADDRELK